MAQQLVTDQGIVFLPGAYPSIQVQKVNAGLATSGVIALVGEADAGPDWSLEPSLTTNFFGPDDFGAVQAKYKSGNLVEAYRAAINASSDPNITGSVASVYLVKTNTSLKASGALTRSGLSNYGLLADKSYGDLGNLINVNAVASPYEVGPSTGLTTYIPTPNGSTLALRVDGDAKQTLSISALISPTTLVGHIISASSTGLNSLSSILGTGGVDRGVLAGEAVTVTLTLVASGNNVVISGAGVGFSNWETTPSVGDTLIIPVTGEYGAGQDSGIKGAASANAGAYVVTAATSGTISATKLRNDTAGVLTPPVNAGPTAINAGQTDILCFSPINVKVVNGVNRNILTGLVGQNVTGTASGSSLKLVLATGQVWAALPQVNDYIFIPASAPAGMHAGGVNGGWYTVTAASVGTGAGASSITATRLSNGNPASFGATAIAAVTDIQCLRPQVDGLAKALEVYDGGGADNVNTLFYALSSTPVNWLSTPTVPALLTSTAEYNVTLNTNRQSDQVSEVLTPDGGKVALTIGYNGTTASLTIGTSNPLTLTTTVTGGVGQNLSINLTKYKTVSDLAKFISSQPGYSAIASTTLVGQLPLIVTYKDSHNSVVGTFTTLDAGTYTICSENGALPGRIKRDAYALFVDLNSSSILVQLGTTIPPMQATAGLPEPQATFFLSGGAKGGTISTNSNKGVTGAIDACQKLQINFLVTLFSQDAAIDTLSNNTDSSSDYTVDGLNAYAKSHVLLMSTFKRRRNRQAFVSKRSTFANDKLAANNLAHYRVTMTFQDVNVVDSSGNITQFQPWMGAVLAAGMQAAGFYRSILFKLINCSGAVMNTGTQDFDSGSDSDLEAAVKNGLLAIQPAPNGGFRWNTDQTTYGIDANFVFNSTQVVYTADTVALSSAQRMEDAFVGQSLADVNANVALSFLKGIFSDLKRLKLLVGDDEAPAGFSTAKVKITQNTMTVLATVKVSGPIVFIPISFQIVQVQSSASA